MARDTAISARLATAILVVACSGPPPLAVEADAGSEPAAPADASAAEAAADAGDARLDGDDPACAPPRCLTDFATSTATCQGQGTCISEEGPELSSIDTCWSNGVKEFQTLMVSQPAGSSTTRVTWPDGLTTCYFWAWHENDAIIGGAFWEFSIRDAAGRLVFSTRVWPDGRKEVVAQIPGGPLILDLAGRVCRSEELTRSALGSDAPASPG